MTYLNLLQESDDLGLNVREKPIEGYNGLIRNRRIAINKNLTQTKKTCVLAEELGHYHTTHGNILDQSCIKNRKQERRARGWAYERLIPVSSLVKAYLEGNSTRYEVAEFLEVTEEFLEDTIQYYKEKHGSHYKLGNYLICFEPLAVYRKIF